MGPNISPLFPDIVMEDLENNCLNTLKCTHNAVPLFYFRYVDDTRLCIKKDDIDLIINTFNNYNEHLKFTHEIQFNNQINFLDITLIRSNNKVVTNWPMASERLLNYNSNRTIQQKRNIVSNLTVRAILLSSETFHNTIYTFAYS